MAIVLDGPVLPADLTTFVREVPQPANFVLNQILPDVYIEDNRVDLGIITRANRMARFRAYDANLHRAQRQTATTSIVQLPPLSDTLVMGELERLQLEFARTGGTNTGAFVNAIYNDAEELTRNVLHRMEFARGDVLVDGKFTLGSLAGETGLVIEADFGVPTGNFMVPQILWSATATADILSDLNAWVTYYINLNGYAPKGMWISRQTSTQLLSNQLLRTAAGTLLGAASFLSRAALDASLAAHMLPPILGVYDSMVDVDGVATRILPANKVIFVPPDGVPFGRTVWGLSATALEIAGMADAGLSFEDAPGIVGAVDKSDAPPYRQQTFVDAVGMPVLDNPKALMVATVSA